MITQAATFLSRLIVLALLAALVAACSNESAPLTEKEKALRHELSYLEDLEYVASVEYVDYESDLGVAAEIHFSPVPDNWKSMIREAASRGSRATGSNCAVVAIDDDAGIDKAYLGTELILAEPAESGKEKSGSAQSSAAEKAGDGATNAVLSPFLESMAMQRAAIRIGVIAHHTATRVVEQPPDSLARDPWGGEYRVVAGDTATDFVILSNGPDGIPDTEDDIDLDDIVPTYPGLSHQHVTRMYDERLWLNQAVFDFQKSNGRAIPSSADPFFLSHVQQHGVEDDPWGHPYRVVPQDSLLGFTIYSNGPDGVEGTADDVDLSTIRLALQKSDG